MTDILNPKINHQNETDNRKQETMTIYSQKITAVGAQQLAKAENRSRIIISSLGCGVFVLVLISIQIEPNRIIKYLHFKFSGGFELN